MLSNLEITDQNEKNSEGNHSENLKWNYPGN